MTLLQMFSGKKTSNKKLNMWNAKKMQLSGSIKYSQIDESQRAFLGNIKGEMGTASGAQTSQYTGEGTRRKPLLVWKVLSSTSLHILSLFHSQG